MAADAALGTGELVFRPSLRHPLSQFGCAAILAAISAWSASRGLDSAGVAAGLAVLAACFGAWVLVGRRFQLRLSPSGFEYGAANRRFIFLWSDIAGFGVCRTAQGREYVGFTLANPSALGEQERRANRRFGGFDGYLPGFYGVPAGELAARLEAWRRGAAEPAA